MVVKDSPSSEARWVAEEIRGRTGAQWGSVAVLTRTNAVAQVFEQALEISQPFS